MAGVQRDGHHAPGGHFRPARHLVRVAVFPPRTPAVALAASVQHRTGAFRLVPRSGGGWGICVAGRLLRARPAHLADARGVRRGGTVLPSRRRWPPVVAGADRGAALGSRRAVVRRVLAVIRRRGRAAPVRPSFAGTDATRRHAGAGAGRLCGIRIDVAGRASGQSHRHSGDLVRVRTHRAGGGAGILAAARAGCTFLRCRRGPVRVIVAGADMVRGSAACHLANRATAVLVLRGAARGVGRAVPVAVADALHGRRRRITAGVRDARRSPDRRGAHHRPRCGTRHRRVDPHAVAQPAVRYRRCLGHPRQPPAGSGAAAAGRCCNGCGSADTPLARCRPSECRGVVSLRARHRAHSRRRGLAWRAVPGGTLPGFPVALGWGRFPHFRGGPRRQALRASSVHCRWLDAARGRRGCGRGARVARAGGRCAARRHRADEPAGERGRIVAAVDRGDLAGIGDRDRRHRWRPFPGRGDGSLARRLGRGDRHARGGCGEARARRQPYGGGGHRDRGPIPLRLAPRAPV